MNLDELKKTLELVKASIEAKSIPKADSDKLNRSGGKKMKNSKHMNGKNVEQYNYEGEKTIRGRVPKDVADVSPVHGENKKLEKRAPKGVDPKKHESCVMDVKAKGHDVGSAHAICTSSMKKEEQVGPDMASPEKPKGLENKRKPVTHDECGRPFAKDEHSEPDEETKNFLEHWEPKTKHPKEATAGMPQPKKSGQKITPTGFKIKLVKALEDAGHRESALLLKNWDELDKTAEHFMKSNYGPKGMGLYNETDNIKRKAKNTGEEYKDIGQNKKTKKYTTMGSSMAAAHEKAQQKEYDKKAKASVKQYTPEEIKAMNEARGLKKSSDVPEKCTSCGEGKPKFKAKNELGTWWDCPSCKTTGLAAKDVKKGDLKVAPEGSNNRDTYLQEFEKSSEIEFLFYNDDTIDVEYDDTMPVEMLTKAFNHLESLGYEDLEKKEWSPKAKHKSKSGGLTQEGVESYRRANPGSKLKTAVTEDKPKGKRAKRRKSFCARNKGQIDMHNIDCRKTPKKRACLARKKWKC